MLIHLKRPCLILLWHHQNHHTFTFSPFLMMTIKWFLFWHDQDMHDSHSPPLSSKFFLTSSKPTWFTFSPFLMMTTIIQGLIFLTSSKSSWLQNGSWKLEVGRGSYWKLKLEVEVTGSWSWKWKLLEVEVGSGSY